jgi:hypothetical protein
MAQVPLNSNAKRPKFFKEDATDALTSMMLELMAELWTVKERVYVLENTLSKQDKSLPQNIEDFQPTESQIAELENKRSVFISSIMRCLEDNKTAGGT